MTTTRKRRAYDHRFPELIRGTGDIQIATRIGVPHSTARGWAQSSTPEVVTVDIVDRSTIALEREVVLLRERNAKLIAVVRLLVVLAKVLAITLRGRRVIDGGGKERLLRAVERSRTALSLRVALRILV